MHSMCFMLLITLWLRPLSSSIYKHHQQEGLDQHYTREGVKHTRWGGGGGGSPQYRGQKAVKL